MPPPDGWTGRLRWRVGIRCLNLTLASPCSFQLVRVRRPGDAGLAVRAGPLEAGAWQPGRPKQLVLARPEQVDRKHRDVQHRRCVSCLGHRRPHAAPATALDPPLRARALGVVCRAVLWGHVSIPELRSALGGLTRRVSHSFPSSSPPPSSSSSPFFLLFLGGIFVARNVTCRPIHQGYSFPGNDIKFGTQPNPVAASTAAACASQSFILFVSTVCRLSMLV